MIGNGLQVTGFALSAIGFAGAAGLLLHRSMAGYPRTQWLILSILLNGLGAVLASAARFWPPTAAIEGVLPLGQIALSVIALGCLVRSLMVPARVE
ncbi:MAG: hypothetical protein SF070_15875 [Gemmatimonadota bacterium]|nr:hypothetical protein [Gemmatimonadota bacterium]